MTDTGIYSDIAVRTGGDIYIGVVGPVRTGKSTLIKRFTENLILPGIESESDRVRARDEMPQSASGRTVMTTEPKFIPENAARIPLDEGAECRVKLIDCVGYIVPGAMGLIEEGQPRMVMTPWSETPLPFEEAAETGTRKVIREHSTVGILVTTDGSIGELPRESYVDAEKRVVDELKEINKPFIVVLNTLNPYSEQTEECRRSMEEKYGVRVVAVNCMELNYDDVNKIIEQLLYEFPLREIGISVPEWIDALDSEHRLKAGLRKFVCDAAKGAQKLADVQKFADALCECEYVDSVRTACVDMGKGTVSMQVITPRELFYNVVEETTGFAIDGEESLMRLLGDMAEVKRKYDKVAGALEEVSRKGYGIVSPSIDELTLEEPEIVKQGSRFGVRLKASAPSIHMIRADIETEVSPIVGTEKQSEDLVHYLLNEFEVDPKKIWESNIFGKSLHELVNEGLHNKLYRMPDDAQLRLQETLQKIINEGSGGLICIIL